MDKEVAALIARLVKTANAGIVLPRTNNMEQLRKAAMDNDLQARMEKTSRALASGLYHGAKSLFGGAKSLGSGAVNGTSNLVTGTALRPFTSRVPGAGVMGPRQFSGTNTMLTAAAAPAAYAGHGELQENAANTVGSNYNPLTWGRNRIGQQLGMSQGPSHEDVYKRNNDKLTGLRDKLKGEIDSASGDPELQRELKARMAKGDETGEYGDSSTMFDPLSGRFGGLNPLRHSLGGLNPFAPDSGKTYHDRMLGKQNLLQGDYDKAMKESGPQPGDVDSLRKLQGQLDAGGMLPNRRAQLEAELKSMRTRMNQPAGHENDDAKAIAARMSSAGMYRKPFAAPNTPTLEAGAGNWGNIGRRPTRPSGFGFNPYANASSGGAWDSVIGNGQSPYG